MTNNELTQLCVSIIEEIEKEDIVPTLTYTFDGHYHTISWGDMTLFEDNELYFNSKSLYEMKVTIKDSILEVLKSNIRWMKQINGVVINILKEKSK